MIGDNGDWRTLSVNETTAQFLFDDNEVAEKLSHMYWLECDFLIRVLNELQPGDVFYDVGANVGLFTCFAAKTIEEGTVVAFEPFERNASLLQENAAANGDNVQVQTIALADEWGTESFVQPDDSVGSQIGALAPDREDWNHVVDIAPADGLVSHGEIPPPDVVKIDVEGAEPRVIKGMEEILSDSGCRTLFCEVHLSHPDGIRPSIADAAVSVEQLKNTIAQNGFDVRIVRPDRHECYLVAKRQ